ncbi:Transcription initiation factor IID [Fragilaria crotonensis]|nr:Transcription initiation factor IID [Fragilaria crotonensis]
MSSNPVSVPNPTAAPAVPVAAPSKTGGGKKDPAKAAATVKKKARRKKPTSAKGPTSQAIVTAARSATGELNSFKAAEFAKRKDPLWYRSSEVLQAISGDSSSVPGLLAEQVDLVEAALQRNNLTRADVTPQAFGVLLEQARRYALEIVADAQDCAYAAHRHEITRADLMMALELRTDQANTHTIVELQKMTLVAHNLNRIPIPPIPQHCYSGVVPPKPHQLTSRTFDIITGAQTAQKMNQPLPSPRNKKNTTKSSASGNNSKNTASSTATTKNTPSYGASRGRLIPISLQTKSTPTIPGPAAAPPPAAQAAAAPAPTSSNVPTTTTTPAPKVTPAQSSVSGAPAPVPATAASGTK